jgi:hypothetical protein
MIVAFREAIKLTNIVVAFDMVNEEDTTPPIKAFV